MAPKGNQNALGNKGGTPRTVSPPKEEMIKLGKELVQWVKDNDPLHISCWYSIEKEISDKDWRTYQIRPEFVVYYERAQKIIGMKYLDKRSNVRDGISHRWMRTYFKDFKSEENEKLEFQAKLAKVQKEEDEKDAIRNAAQYIAGIVKENSP